MKTVFRIVRSYPVAIGGRSLPQLAELIAGGCHSSKVMNSHTDYPNQRLLVKRSVGEDRRRPFPPLERRLAIGRMLPRPTEANRLAVEVPVERKGRKQSDATGIVDTKVVVTIVSALLVQKAIRRGVPAIR